MYNLLSGEVSLYCAQKLMFVVYREKAAASSKSKKWTKRYPKRSPGGQKALQWETSKLDSGFSRGRVTVYPLLFHRYGALRLEFASLFIPTFVAQYDRIGPASLPKRLTIILGSRSYMEHHDADRERIKIRSRSFRGAPRFKTQ
jgi:hypothetical protein